VEGVDGLRDDDQARLGLCVYRETDRLWFNGLVVMISVLHTEGLRFDPGLNQPFFGFDEIRFRRITDEDPKPSCEHDNGIIIIKKKKLESSSVSVKWVYIMIRPFRRYVESIRNAGNMTTVRIGRCSSICTSSYHTPSRPQR
jgi:hypothetical protein